MRKHKISNALSFLMVGTMFSPVILRDIAEARVKLPSLLRRSENREGFELGLSALVTSPLWGWLFMATIATDTVECMFGR